MHKISKAINQTLSQGNTLEDLEDDQEEQKEKSVVVPLNERYEAFQVITLLVITPYRKN